MELRNDMSLAPFLNDVISLLRLASGSREVLFHSSVRDSLSEAVEEAVSRLEDSSNLLEHVEEPALFFAGLTGPQLTFKLDSFQASYDAFKEQGARSFWRNRSTRRR